MEVRTLHSIQQIYDPPSPGERKFEKLNMQQLNLSLLDLSIVIDSQHNSSSKYIALHLIYFKDKT